MFPLGGGMVKVVRHVEPPTDDFSKILIAKKSDVIDSPCNFLMGVNDFHVIVFAA
jgi:hypothetical protein